MKRLKATLAFAAWMALVASAANADYIPKSGYYSYQGSLGGSSGYAVADGMSGPRNVLWGTYRLQGGVYNSTTGKYVATGTPYTVACIDLIQNASSSWLYYEDVDLMDAPIGHGNQEMTFTQAMRLRELWTEHYSQTGSSVGKAAFQIAVWEIVYQQDVASAKDYDVRSGWVLGQGGFQAAAPSTGGSVQKQAGDLAQSWLISLNGWNEQRGDDQFLNVRALVRGDVQDWAFFSPDAGIIPAPGAVLLGVVGLAGVGWLKRRFS